MAGTDSDLQSLAAQREAAYALVTADVGRQRRRAGDAAAVQRSAGRGVKIALVFEGDRQNLTPARSP
jgi:hypothetical protein